MNISVIIKNVCLWSIILLAMSISKLSGQKNKNPVYGIFELSGNFQFYSYRNFLYDRSRNSGELGMGTLIKIGYMENFGKYSMGAQIIYGSNAHIITLTIYEPGLFNEFRYKDIMFFRNPTELGFSYLIDYPIQTHRSLTAELYVSLLNDVVPYHIYAFNEGMNDRSTINQTFAFGLGVGYQRKITESLHLRYSYRLQVHHPNYIPNYWSATSGPFARTDREIIHSLNFGFVMHLK